MAYDCAIEIGMVEYRFFLPAKCSLIRHKSIELSLSFGLMGDFIPSALSDNIIDTVDYAVLCDHLKQLPALFDCSDRLYIEESIGRWLKAYSVLIHDIRISNLTLHCHDGFAINGP